MSDSVKRAVSGPSDHDPSVILEFRAMRGGSWKASVGYNGDMIDAEGESPIEAARELWNVLSDLERDGLVLSTLVHRVKAMKAAIEAFGGILQR